MNSISLLAFLRLLLIPLLLGVFGLLPGLQAGDKLTIDEVQEIIATKGDSIELIEPLKIYPKASEYEVTSTFTRPDGGTKTVGPVTVREKTIAGRFIVSEGESSGSKFAMVVEFDGQAELYKKYVINGGNLTSYQVGTRIENKRSISWIELIGNKHALKRDYLSVDTHTDTSTTWKAMFFENGDLVVKEVSVAKVTKKK